MTNLPMTLLAWVAMATLSQCAFAEDPPPSTYGANPLLDAPQESLVPTVHVAKAVGWPEGQQPQAAQGLRVVKFAGGLEHPRWLLALPNGDVLVAETDAPPKPDEEKGIRNRFMHYFMKRAGADHASPNRITLLRDADGDGVAEMKSTFLENLDSPFGMALVNGRLYVANTGSIVSVAYHDGQLKAGETPKELARLPAGSRNHHWTKSLIASLDGTALYVGVGSNSNAAENGIEAERGRAAIWEFDIATGIGRVYASGLRNPVGLAWQPDSKALWVAVNERDEIGDNIVPDYMTSVKDGGFYGFPWSYYGVNIDARVQPPNPDMVARALVPDYALGPHTASLGLCAARPSPLLPAHFASGMFVGQHGSWNRRPYSGYKVIFVPFANGRPAGAPEDVLTGFLNSEGQARGRPVGVTLDARGALLVADDVGDAVWRVSAGAPAAPATP